MLRTHAPQTSPTANRKARRAAQRRGRKRPASAHPVPSRGLLSTPVKALHDKALAHHQAGEMAEAEGCYRQMLAADPACAAAHFGLGNLALQLDKPEIAYDHYKQAVTLDEANPAHWAGFGQCLRVLAHYEAAVIAFENAVARSPADAGLLTSLATALFETDRFEEARAGFEQALKIDPAAALALYGKALVHHALGEFSKARACFQKVLEIKPGFIDAYSKLADLAEGGDEIDVLTKRIEAVAEREEGTPRRYATLHFAAAKGHRRRKRYDEAFAHFRVANDTLRQIGGFDREKMTRTVDLMMEAFTPAAFRQLKAAGSDCELPVFIVGMPRSGSTLVEQILSSHPDVDGAGEIEKMGRTAELLAHDFSGGLRYPTDIAAFDPRALASLGADYLAALRLARSQSALRITDKMLANFLNLGLIGVLFPGARVVHCRRDPMDTCLSCYFQNFMVGQGALAYTNDLEDLGAYYRDYERLMAHWRAVLPNPMLEVDYEDVVANQEAVSWRLVAHAGLAWDDACLAFHETRRGVKTASDSQVRKPVYRSSVGAWRHYEKHLSPLKQALGLPG